MSLWRRYCFYACLERIWDGRTWNVVITEYQLFSVCEAIGGCQIGEWSSLMHILALSSVIGRPIFTIYPSCSKAIRPLLQGLIKPRIQTSNKISDNNCFYILWSRDGGLDNRSNAIYVPNHFVPLVQREQVVKLRSFKKTAKLLLGPQKRHPP